MPTVEYNPSPHYSNRSSPNPGGISFSPSQRPPISPPKTRPESAEESAAAMVENYRNYTATLRSQFEGERAHMAADRDRMCEVMEEERALWDEERKWLKQKIKELEMLVENKRSDVSSSHLVNQKPISHPRIPSCSSNGVW